MYKSLTCHPIQKHLYESEFTLRLAMAAQDFDLDIEDLGCLDDILPDVITLDCSTAPVSAVVRPEESIMDVTTQTPSVTTSYRVNGSLSSRIRCLAYEAATCAEPTQWRHQDHPAYPLIHQELLEAYRTSRLEAMMDELEGLGCVVTFDKATIRLSLGMTLDKVCGNFGEHTALFDRRNKRLIDRVNGIAPIKALNDTPVVDTTVVSPHPMQIVTFDLSPAA